MAALRAGQVDWIEAPPPDAVASLKSAGFKIITNAYPHNWTWHLSRVEGSPWNDIRVRKAANLAIDREGMQELLSGLMIPAEGFMPPGHQWFGKPTFKLKYDPAEAKKLLEEAGYGPDKPSGLKALISPSGSGQMQPLPMNEFIQQNLAEVGIKVDFEVVEWNQLINIWRAGASDPSAKGGQSLNFTYFIQDPFTGFIRHMQCSLKAPSGTNWGHYCDPEMDKLLDEVRNSFDPKEQTSRAAEGSRENGERGAVPDGHARRQRTRLEPQGEELRSGQELVPGLLAYRHGELTRGHVCEPTAGSRALPP